MVFGNELIRRVRAAAKGVASKDCRGRARPMQEEQRTEWEQVGGGGAGKRTVEEVWWPPRRETGWHEEGQEGEVKLLSRNDGYK